MVAVDEYEKRMVMVLDDGCGMTIEVCWVKPSKPAITNTTGDTEGNGDGNGNGNGNGTGVQDGHETRTGGKDGHGKGERDGNVPRIEDSKDIDTRNVDVGTVVKVRGGIGEFRGVRQILLERLSTSPLFPYSLPASLPSICFFSDQSLMPWTGIRYNTHHKHGAPILERTNPFSHRCPGSAMVRIGGDAAEVTGGSGRDEEAEGREGKKEKGEGTEETGEGKGKGRTGKGSWNANGRGEGQRRSKGSEAEEKRAR